MTLTSEGSITPQRVPIIRPARGVRPIEVSMHLPESMAVMEEPFPRWQVMTFISSRPVSSPRRCDT